jgi:hypothetical protein
MVKPMVKGLGLGIQCSGKRVHSSRFGNHTKQMYIFG